MKKKNSLQKAAAAVLWLALLWAWLPGQETEEIKKGLDDRFQMLSHRLDQLEKAIDDVLWFHRVGDIAYIDKLTITGPPAAKVRNPNAVGAKNPVKFNVYVFIPQRLTRNKKYPLLILPHGGVHANFTTYHTHIVREMVAQGYVVAAPEYRGSTGYGSAFYNLIDYGGNEIEDVYACRNHMVENYDFVDPARVGIVGWSHGGMLALLNIFFHPDDYQVAFAGVPVSDLLTRLGYKPDSYAQEFAASYHIGQTIKENEAEYRRRSPITYVKKLQTPLLIHTNTNDDDVYYIEVKKLIEALQAEKKEFSYEVFKDAPGGHSFDRIDTRLAKETRLKIYDFIGQFLDPPYPFKSLKDLEKAGYR